jgi:ubiquitin-like modifier-activating enzyme ATG7
MASRPLQFAPFISVVDTGFWHELTRRKLEVYQLDDSPQPLQGSYTNGDSVGLPPRLSLEFDAFDKSSSGHSRSSLAHGTLVITNTMEDFKMADKAHLITESGRKVWEAIVSGRAIDDPSLLTQFFLITFADLKKYHYYYWFAFPALCPEEAVTADKAVSLETYLTSEQMMSLQSSWDRLPTSSDRNFFLVAMDGDTIYTVPLREHKTFCQTHPKVGYDRNKLKSE